MTSKIQAMTQVLAKRCKPHTLAIFVLALLLTACSTTTFFYNRLHIFIPWMVDDYVNLTRQQDDQLESLLIDYLAVHRRDYLPRYIDWLNQLLVALDHPLTTAQMSDFYNTLAAESRLLEADSLDWMLQIGETLSAEQIADFIENMNAQQQDYAEEYLSRSMEEVIDDIYARMEDSLSDFMGRLQPAQRQRLREAARNTQRTDELWLDQRALRIDRLTELLARPPGWQEQVRQLVEEQYRAAPAEQEQAYQHNLTVFLQAVTDVVNARSEKQDRRLRHKLTDLRDDLQRLTEQQR